MPVIYLASSKGQPACDTKGIRSTGSETSHVMASGLAVDAFVSETREVTPDEQHHDSDVVQPEPMEQWPSRHDPEAGEHEQHAADHADPGKESALLPSVSCLSHSSHGMSMDPRITAC